MNLAILGANGNMGKRYCAIARHLGHTVYEIDLPYDAMAFGKAVSECDHFIVATPTNFHAPVISDLLQLFMVPRNRFILCEKPITKNLEILYRMYDHARNVNAQIYCVNQYNYLPEVVTRSEIQHGLPSSYNYYRTGDDGIHWDCFQIYALATGKVAVSNTSPIWHCNLNGHSINIKHMDAAYVDMIADFMNARERVWPRELVIKTTEKIIRAIECEKS